MQQNLTTSEVARLLGVAVGSVANWIDQGQLKAGRTPGGHRRVAAADLMEFIRKQKLPIPPELQPSPPKILIVDDEKQVTDFLTDEFSERHPECEILQANDGFAAGELVGSFKPSVVILDLRMPDMDGFEVCRRIKSRPEAQETVVIAITAHLFAETKEKILACGAQACFPKPLDDAFFDAVAQALGQ